MTRTVRSSATGAPVAGEHNTQPSQTVPNQALTIREILVRYASGTIPDIMTRDENYSEDNDDLRGLDISEYHDIKNRNTQEIQSLKKQYEDEQKPVEPVKPLENGPDNTSSD